MNLLALLLVLQPAGAQTVELPNGARAISVVQPMNGDVEVTLWIDADGLQETGSNHGIRHLVEHLVAHERHGRAMRLERRGLFMEAETRQRVSRFSMKVKKDQLGFAIQNLGELLRPLMVDEMQLATEVKIIGHELALTSNADKALGEAQAKLQPNNPLHPGGTVEALAKLTPSQVMSFSKAMFSPHRVVLSVVGEHDSGSALLQAKTLFNSIPGWARTEPPKFEGVANAPDRPWSGSAVAIKVGPFQSRSAAIATATGYVIANHLGQVTMYSSAVPWDSVMVLYSPQPNLSRRIQALGLSEVQFAQHFGRQLAQWPEESSVLTEVNILGFLTKDSVNFGEWKSTLGSMQLKEVGEGIQMWKSGVGLEGRYQ